MENKELSREEVAKIKRLSKKYNIETKILSYILRNYNSFEQFIKEYIEALDSSNPIYVTKDFGSTRPTVQYFELTDSNIIGRNTTYGKLFRDILDTKYGFTVEGNFEETLEKVVKGKLKTKLKQREYNILMSYYGIDVPKVTLQDLATKYSVSRQRIAEIKDKAVELLRNDPDVKNLMKKVLNEEHSRKAVAEVANIGDIFVSDKSPSHYSKREKFLMVYLKLEIDEVEFSKNCMEQLGRIKGKIEEYIEGAPQRRVMLARLERKKQQLIAENATEVTAEYQEMIDGISENYKYNENICISTFGKKIYEIFKSNGIRTIADVVNLTMKDLTSMDGIIPTDIAIISEKVKEYGYFIPKKSSIKTKETYEGNKEVQTSIEEYMLRVIDTIKKSVLPEAMKNELIEKAFSAREEERQKIIKYFQYRMNESLLETKMHTELDSIDIPRVIRTLLSRMHARTIEDLMRKSKYDIEMLPGCGEGKAGKIYAVIESFGYEIPEDRNISFKEHNTYLMEIDSNTINANEIAQEIMESEQLSDEDKSMLLDELYERAVEKLKVLYAEFDRRRKEHEEVAEERFDTRFKTPKEIEWDRVKGQRILEQAEKIGRMQEVIQGRISNFEGTSQDDDQDGR